MVLSSGAIAGIVIAIIIVIPLIALAVWQIGLYMAKKTAVDTGKELLNETFNGGVAGISSALGGIGGISGGSNSSVGKKAYDMNFSDHVDF